VRNIARIQAEYRRTWDKLCTGCGKVKPLYDFYRKRKSATRSSGYSWRCRKCEDIRRAAQ
jgi:RNase P subunit RPR2